MKSIPAPRSVPPHSILVTGGTGYLGRELIVELIRRGHAVRALVRPGSERRLPTGTQAVVGNPLCQSDIAGALPGAHTLVHLVGVPKPNPRKFRQFRDIDLASAQASAAAAMQAYPPPHVVYVSVAQPAPVMKAYVTARREGEAAIRAAGVRATFIRPWYVLGPGHRWPYFLVPVYAVLKRLPPTRDGAHRLDFVTLSQMTRALVHAIEHSPEGVRVVEVPEIRRFR
jgi:uncharacterized protein YbjT (DUF2867 family)